MHYDFDIFVLPFSIGLVFILGYFIYKTIYWVRHLDGNEKRNIRRRIFTVRSIYAFWEVFTESLLHRRVFKTNPLLGYMHMSLAFGWFMLIVLGNLQVKLYSVNPINPPYLPIFFYYFVNNNPVYPYAPVFDFVMDALLLFILTGLSIAIVKRFWSRIVGMKKTSQLKLGDRLALSSLWLIFPLRLFAEGLTSAIHNNGNFLVKPAGYLFAEILPVQLLEYPAWWAYSFALGLFFVSIPYSRYMHIPTEVALIFLRNYGVRTRKKFSSYSEMEVLACSRCGICLDTCQLLNAAQITKIQSVYFLRSIRENNIDTKHLLTCMMCGRCTEKCPVNIDNSALRTVKRAEYGVHNTSKYEFLKAGKYKVADIIYFAGCMSHLTPGIKKSMLKIMDAAGENYYFMDSDKEACCGRPLVLAGHGKAAKKLMDYNKHLIDLSQAKVMVISCPICYKTFKDDYKLNITVLHHSEYILNLIRENKIQVEKQAGETVYHDPCELGRGMAIYKEPRLLLEKVTTLHESGYDKEKALCCGGSLASITTNAKEKELITRDVLQKLTKNKPDTIATACPLCKKTLAKDSDTIICDLSEMVAKAMIVDASTIKNTRLKKTN